MSDIINRYVGKPWVSGGRGPDEFDCWGLVKYVMANEYDINLNVIGDNLAQGEKNV